MLYIQFYETFMSLKQTAYVVLTAECWPHMFDYSLKVVKYLVGLKLYEEYLQFLNYLIDYREWWQT